MKTKTKKKQAKRKMKHEILRTNVAGVQYADVQLAHNLKAGAIAKMYWERDNKHDPLAIRLEVDGIKIGYIPKQSTSLLHDYRNAGHRLTCEVTGYFRTNPTWNQLHVKVLAESLLVKNADVDFDEPDYDPHLAEEHEDSF